MPIIEGGTYRVWPRTQDLQLSAEQSYDPNMDPDNQSLLHYHWECQSTSKVKPCDGGTVRRCPSRFWRQALEGTSYI